VTAVQAAEKPVAGAHSIWELVLHIEAWEREAISVLEGKTHEVLAGEKDWPPVRATGTEAWAAALADLEATTRKLIAAIRAAGDEKLTQSAGGAEYNFYFLLHGVVQHNLYHAGQIALLKRAYS
jgi:uncharacterized damage-inducible protein DinB